MRGFRMNHAMLQCLDLLKMVGKSKCSPKGHISIGKENKQQNIAVSKSKIPVLNFYNV